MTRASPTVAVTGMNATDNPAPGVGIARALREDRTLDPRIIGLGYDPLDPGFYMAGLLDGGALLPYPSSGKLALRQRLHELRARFGMDVFVPALDSELRAAAALADELARGGIRTLVPSLESLEKASKSRLAQLNAEPGLRVPVSHAVTSADGLADAVQKLGFPVVVKGPYYGAEIVTDEAEALAAYHRFVSRWGLPVIVQRFVRGEEYNVAAVGDGTGATVGAVAMRKMALTDKGKGWSGITVQNHALIELTEAVIDVLRWRGAIEVECLREEDSGDLYIAEINPRFPAWIYLSAGAGRNLPAAAVRLALGLDVPRPMPAYRAGVLFVRISLDQVSDLSTYEQLTSRGAVEPRKASS
jgi:carbamoyl-phosphate synthase large subunit